VDGGQCETASGYIHHLSFIIQHLFFIPHPSSFIPHFPLTTMSTSTVYFLLPEIVLIAAAVLIYIAGAFLRTQKAWSWFALLEIILSMLCLSRQHGMANSSVLISDGFTIYIRWLTLALGLLLVLMNSRPLIGGGTPESIGSLLLVIAGGMMVVSANDLILLFVALELISIPTYILLYLGPGGRRLPGIGREVFLP